MEPFLIPGDTSWNGYDVDYLKKDYPFLRDAKIEPLRSPGNDNWLLFFKADPHGIFALHDSEFLYYLGKDIEDAEEKYEVVKAHGWDMSPFSMVEANGEVVEDPSSLRLGFCGRIFSKIFPDRETRVADLTAFQKDIIQDIEEDMDPSFWDKKRIGQETCAVFKQLMNDAPEVEFAELRITSQNRVYLRWRDDFGDHTGAVIVGKLVYKE